ncbi:MAG: DNA polymerase subunit beta [bacterium]|nr:DNA polymerase subunit beta [bacterium]
MEPRIPIDREKIEAFCNKWKVKEFYLFGSVLRDDFGPDSDVDVCLQFQDAAPWSLWDMVRMKYELEDYFDRPVDILEADAIQNPYRRYEIQNNRKLIHAET